MYWVRLVLFWVIVRKGRVRRVRIVSVVFICCFDC